MLKSQVVLILIRGVVLQMTYSQLQCQKKIKSETGEDRWTIYRVSSGRFLNDLKEKTS